MRSTTKRLCTFMAAVFVLSAAQAQDVLPKRTWEELKVETLSRAERSAYPVFHIDPADARAILDNIHSLSPQEWGTEWMKVGDVHFARAQSLEASQPAKAKEEYLYAWRLYGMGGWPVASSPNKAESRAKSWKAFEAYGNLERPKVESVTIPFEGKSFKITVQKPDGVTRPPVVIGIAGSDLWRDYAAITMQSFLPHGIAAITVDMPGTGDMPMAARPGAERVFSTLIDYVQSRSDLDGTRIVVRGESWGSYWAARVGYAEAKRLKGVVFQSGPVDGYFQKGWQEKAFQTREFLFDYVESRLHMLGVSSVDEAYEVMPALSLKAQGLLDQPTPPMLVIGGAKDTQVPFSDTELLLLHGSPKYAWINPTGGTMGRSVTVKDQWIFDHVVVPWVQEQFATTD
jgi:esterase FrsA